MNNVLLVGNGFDLAHGLPTKYGDFLCLIKNWAFFLDYYKRKKIPNNDNLLKKYLVNIDSVNADNIKELNEIIQKNSWINYFKKCEAEVDGWIDFEKEIIPVIDFFDFLFQCDVSVNSSYDTVELVKGSFPTAQMLRIAKLWDKYVNVSITTVTINTNYSSKQYGILKKKMMEELRREFDEFVRAFEIYLLEFVDKIENINPIQQIAKLNITSVVSFNYTLTESLYRIEPERVHHIHGMIRKNGDLHPNNMVLGINEQLEQKMDFIYFVKYFQRIQKATGTYYKELIAQRTWGKNVLTDKYTLYVYGHSLDETDEDILKYLIGDINRQGIFVLKPEKVCIFYYDIDDYEQKVINLIKLYGRNIVETYIEQQFFVFLSIEK